MKNSYGTGVNNSLVRVENRGMLTRLLYTNPAGLTKQQLANRLKLSLPTVHLLIKQLFEDGLIYERSTEQSSGGRIPQLICFDYEARYMVGTEVSQNHIRILVMDLAKNVLVSDRIKLKFENTPDYWHTMSDHVNRMIRKSKVPRQKLLGMGMAFPGVVNHSSRVAEFAPTLGVSGISYVGFDDIFSMPVLVENEAKSAAYAEAFDREMEACVYLSITKGVGGAILAGHQLFYGENIRAGEFGHMTLVPNGLECACGKRGCFEAYCSTRRLSCFTDGELEKFFELKDGNALMSARWEEYLEYLSIGISNICIALDTQLILGGDLSSFIDKDFERLKQMVFARSPYATPTMISLSKFGKNASAIGCGLMLANF